MSARRLRGAFYTPEEFAVALTEWAVTKRTDRVLDPSFGGCAFIKAALRVLANRGSQWAGAQVYGVDIYPHCRDAATALSPSPQVRIGDFLALRPADVDGGNFDAIVGNPPYVRHHWLKGRARESAYKAAEELGCKLPRTASTWAYFVLHACQFLRPGGRLAFLVPEAILQADYARPVRDFLNARFHTTRLIPLRERLFDGTDESVVLIAAEGIGPGTTTILDGGSRDAALSLLQRSDAILDEGSTLGERVSSMDTAPSHWRLRSRDRDLVLSVLKSDGVQSFGALATVRIGCVTGANSFFVKSRAELRELGIPSDATVPIVARSRALRTPLFCRTDFEAARDEDARCFLVRPPPRYRSHPAISNWLQQGVKDGVDRRLKCSRRETWYVPELPARPDALLTCSRLGQPLVALNPERYTCTNALHGVRWRAKHVSPVSIVTGFMTAVTATWAELSARRYGGGVLKVEPGCVRTAPVPIAPVASSIFESIVALCQEGDEAGARAVADRVVLHDGLGMSQARIADLRRITAELYNQRQPDRR